MTFYKLYYGIRYTVYLSRKRILANNNKIISNNTGKKILEAASFTKFFFRLGHACSKNDIGCHFLDLDSLQSFSSSKYS